MIVCPHCSYENEDSAMNCANCHINLQHPLENLHEAVRHDLERVEELPPEAQAGDPVVRGWLVIVLLLAIPVSGILALWNFMGVVLSAGNASSGNVAGFLFWLVVTLVCILAAIVVLLRRQPKPNLLPGLRILVLTGMTGGLLFGLMRLTLVILPEHTGRSLIIQYKLGERDFRGANLEQADLSGASLHEANLREVDLSGADLTGAFLIRADLSRANLYEAKLTEANLPKANLSEAILREADLTGAQVHWANLSGADLSGANLTEAFLFRSDLSRANLERAILVEADLEGAILSGANLEGAILGGANLIDAKYSKYTNWPVGFDPQKAGAILVPE